LRPVPAVAAINGLGGGADIAYPKAALAQDEGHECGPPVAMVAVERRGWRNEEPAPAMRASKHRCIRAKENLFVGCSASGRLLDPRRGSEVGRPAISISVVRCRMVPSWCRGDVLNLRASGRDMEGGGQPPRRIWNRQSC